MKNILLIVDPQNDFITGTLPVEGAEERMKKLAEYIKARHIEYDYILMTMDSHPTNHSSFKDNEAIKGGAFYFEGGSTLIDESNFTDNHAIKGGSGYIAGENTVIKNSLFENNNATHDLKYDLPDVLKNSKTAGGAIYIVGHDINVTSSNFTDNHADDDGGAIFKGGAINCTFIGTSIKEATHTAFLRHWQLFNFGCELFPLILWIDTNAIIKSARENKFFAQFFAKFSRNKQTTFCVYRMPVFAIEHVFLSSP